MSPAAKASAHFLIGRDGRVGNLVPTDRVAWHAGVSSFAGLTGLNKYSIGIELVALGPLVPAAGAGFKSPVYGTRVPEVETYHGPHPDAAGYVHWHKYTTPQLAALDTVLTDLFGRILSLKRVIGHRDVARGRKLDPFPLDTEALNSRFAR